MRNAFVIHGSGGNKNAHWYPWLKEKLEERGLQVFLVQFPIGENQTLQNWLGVLEPMKEDLKNSILVGHSLGVPFILNVLNLWDKKVHAVLLISGFTGYLEAEGEPNLEDFAEREFNWERIKNNSNYFCVVHSDNDQYVPLEKAEELAERLGIKVFIVESGAHFQK